MKNEDLPPNQEMGSQPQRAPQADEVVPNEVSNSNGSSSVRLVWTKSVQKPRRRTVIRSSSYTHHKRTHGTHPSTRGVDAEKSHSHSRFRQFLASICVQVVAFGVLALIVWFADSMYPGLMRFFEQRRIQVADAYKTAAPDIASPPLASTPLPLPPQPIAPVIQNGPTATLSASTIPRMADSGAGNDAKTIEKTDKDRLAGPAGNLLQPKILPSQSTETKTATTVPPSVQDKSLPAKTASTPTPSPDFMGPPEPPVAKSSIDKSQPIKAEIVLNPQNGNLEVRFPDGRVQVLNTMAGISKQPQPSPVNPQPSPVNLAPATTKTLTGRVAPAQLPMPALLSPIKLKEVKFASPDLFLQALGNRRPRLVHNAESWAKLQSMVRSDAVGKSLLSSLEEAGRNLLKEPVLKRIFGASHGGSMGSETLGRITTLGCLHHLGQSTPDWSNRAKAELLSLCDPQHFPDWGKGSDLSRMLVASCLAYDWFASSMDPQSLSGIQKNLLQKGLQPLLLEIKQMNRDQEMGRDGLNAMAAVLIFCMTFHGEMHDVAHENFSLLLKKWVTGLSRFSPDGIWPEGMMDGEEILFSSAPILETFASNKLPCNFDLFEGFAQANRARIMKMGAFSNVGGSGFGLLSQKMLLGPVSTWLSGRYGNPGYPGLVAEAKTSYSTAHLGTAGHLLHFNPWAAADGILPSELCSYWDQSSSLVMRTGWNPDALVVDVKAMDAIPNPFLEDMGTFSLFANGVDWGLNLRDLPRQAGVDLLKSGYTSRRSAYNGMDLGVPFKPEDKAHFTHSRFTDTNSMAILEHRCANSNLRSWKRGFFIEPVSNGKDHKGFFLVQDEVNTRDEVDWVWQMNTRANVRIRAGEAILEQENQIMMAVILSPKEARFTVEEAPVQNPPLSLMGYRTLQIRMPAMKGKTTVTVAFYPQLEKSPKSMPTVTVPLEKWIPDKKHSSLDP